MKKTVFAILFIIPLVLSAQWYGDGTSPSTAYYGVINSSYTMWTWNTTNFSGGVVYVGRSGTGENDLEVGSGGTLTISQGITVKFCTTSSDLRITGTGVLNAVGSSSVPITFTKDALATWGHISFEASTGSSTIQYCIIEWGSKTGSGIEGWGGGIHINTSNLTVSYCLIRYNTAIWGGGIFVNQSVNPTFENCHFYSNTATSSGGGLYLWYGSAPKMENCIIDDNECTNTGSTYGGGGLGVYTGGSGTAKLTNCIIVNNVHQTLGTNRGDNIHLNSGNAINFINCIVWSSDNSVYIDGNPVSTNFVNSAVQRVYNSSGEVSISSYTNSFKLNSLNTGANPDGPYFNAIDGSDWSLKVISPCRDAGTTPSPTVPNDYDGNSRVGAYDIGAYEVQYNGWKMTASSTTWNSTANWDQGVVPTSTQNVVIPTGATNYPTGSSTHTIDAGYGMVLEPGAQATFATLSTTGDIKLKSDASNISSLIINSIDISAIVELYLTGGEAGTGNYRWHYISSPFSTSPSITPFTDVTIDLAEYIEALCTSTSDQGWVTYDGYIYKTTGDNETEFLTLLSGKGYNFYDNANNEITISGDLEFVNVVVGLDFNGNETPGGFNLLGNPFPSGLDWNYIITHNFPTETSKGVYFTQNDAQCSYIGGVGTPYGVTGIIPPMQGFFTKTYGTGHSIILDKDARTHNSIHARYKGETIIPLVRLSITKDTLSDETVVRFDEQANPGLDYDFDAIKMFLSDNRISIYSYTGETKYAINGLPFPEDSMNIQLAINSPKADTLKITATQIQGLEDYGLILKDLDQDFSIDLDEVNEYIFNADSGSVTDRFILTVNKLATGLRDIIDPEPENAFNIYSSRGILFINPANDEWNGKRGDLRIYDITGRIVKQQKNIEWYKGVTKEISLSVAQGIYFVEIRAGGLRYVGKVSVR